MNVSVDTDLLGDILVPESDHAVLVADGAVSWYLNGCTEYHFFA